MTENPIPERHPFPDGQENKEAEGYVLRIGKAEEVAALPRRTLNRGFSRKTYLKRYWTLYLLLLLPVAFFIIFRYIPMAYILMAFKKNNIIKPPWLVDWAKNNGFQWFIAAFNDQLFIRALENTVKLNLLDLICGFPAPILMALVLNELAFKRFKRFTQTVLYLPHFLSWIIISSLAVRLLADNDGLINILYKQVTNNKDAVIPFLSNTSWWVGTYIGMGIWKEAGWGTIIYLAALTSISPELYEAAAVDGAGRFRRIWHVTLPGLRPTIIVLLIMRLGYILGSEFDRPLAMSNTLVTDVSTVISIYVYQKGINGGGLFSQTTAVGLFQSVVGVLFLFMANFLAKRFGERGIM